MNDEKKPFNDAIDHFNKVEGNMAFGKNDLKRLPRPLRFIGYIIIGFLSISFLLMIIFNFLD